MADGSFDTLTVTGTSDLGGDTWVGGNLRVGDPGAGLIRTLSVTGAISGGGTLSIAGASDLQGGTRLRSTLQVDGASAFMGNMSISGSLSVQGREVAADGVTLDQHIARTDNPHGMTAAQVGALVSVGGVSNAGGNIDLVQANAITLTPDDVNNRITIGEGHSTQTGNPHGTTAEDVGALPIAGGRISGNLTVGGTTTLSRLSVGGATTLGGNTTISGTLGIGTSPPATGLHVKGGLQVFDSAAQLRIHLNSQNGELTIHDQHGNGIIAFQTRHQHAHLGLGHRNMPGRLMLFNNAAQRTILLDGQKGKIEFSGADCAEYFDIAEAAEIAEPGTVMIVDRDGDLRESQQAYDKRVLGVLSGAGDLQPGIILGERSSHTRRVPVAVIGKVYCKVDARYAPINAGDLLTTSATPGHAMKAQPISINGEAFFRPGTIIGKALESFESGTGMIEIFVAAS